MEFRYSTIVDPSEYDSQGLCEGIALRAHKDQKVEDLGAVNALQDWKDHVAPTSVKTASLAPEFNFLSVSYPETLPDRMEVMAYFNEFIFLQDDVVEAADQATGDAQNDEAEEACRDGAKGKAEAKKATGRRYMVTKASKQMLAIDPGPATAALALWAEWFEKGAGRRNHVQFTTLDEFLEYRILDVGKMYLTGVTIFVMGLTIPEHEADLRSQLCYPAWVALGLTNDLYSIAKEREAAAQSGDAHLVNSLWVLMHEHGISEPEAELRCRQMIKDNVATFVATVEEARKRTDISHDLLVFLDAIQYLISGNLIWTRTAPRYNPGITYNARQLDWMENGTPRSVVVESVEKSQSVGAIRRIYDVVSGGIMGTVKLLLRLFWV